MVRSNQNNGSLSAGVYFTECYASFYIFFKVFSKSTVRTQFDSVLNCRSELHVSLDTSGENIVVHGEIHVLANYITMKWKVVISSVKLVFPFRTYFCRETLTGGCIKYFFLLRQAMDKDKGTAGFQERKIEETKT